MENRRAPHGSVTEDRRAHKRLDEMDFHLKKHSDDIDEIRVSLLANTILTKSIETNTSEIVEIMRGAKGIMFILHVAGKFLAIVAKVALGIGAVYAIWLGFLAYLRCNL